MWAIAHRLSSAAAELDDGKRPGESVPSIAYAFLESRRVAPLSSTPLTGITTTKSELQAVLVEVARSRWLGAA